MKHGCDDSKRLGWAAILLLLVVPWSFVGCAWRVTVPAAPRDPVPVHLTDYGRHTRLALRADDETMRELGCEVRGFPILSNFRIENPD